MLTKESYLSSCEKIPFSKVNIEGVGEIGLRLLRGNEIKELPDDLDKQMLFVIVDENGKRVFDDEDINIIKEKMPFAHKRAIMEKLHYVNGLVFEQEEVKKN